ncbi:helix-turn-helix domain-containing protein [Janthinobacterium sp. ROICE36]|uniref:helix-turn-helix domain-containing protein n=1 Tax=Janthinobacterium sp. ROICE36 TaxID=2048670 RepID=UPI002155AF06|nr:helix-turn-helix domain-containing protein [Janthinobacterium sp. ROICE36]
MPAGDAETLVLGESDDLASLAQALGFFDQAHFSRSFTELVGSTALDYRRSQLPTVAYGQTGRRM